MVRLPRRGGNGMSLTSKLTTIAAAGGGASGWVVSTSEVNNGLAVDSSGNIIVKSMYSGATTGRLYVLSPDGSSIGTTKQFTQSSKGGNQGIILDGSDYIYHNVPNSVSSFQKRNPASSGSPLSSAWKRGFRDTSSAGYYPECMDVDGSGNIYIVSGESNNRASCVTKTNTSDTETFVKNIKPAGTSLNPYIVDVNHNGNYVYWCGYGPADNTNNENAFFARLRDDGSSTGLAGRVLYYGSSSNYGQCYRVINDTSGNIYVLVAVNGAAGLPETLYRNCFVLKFNSSLTKQWETTISPSTARLFMDDFSIGNLALAEGNLYALCGPDKNSGYCNLVILDSSDGSLISSQKINGIGPSGIEADASPRLPIAATDDGFVVMTSAQGHILKINADTLPSSGVYGGVEFLSSTVDVASSTSYLTVASQTLSNTDYSAYIESRASDIVEGSAPSISTSNFNSI